MMYVARKKRDDLHPRFYVREKLFIDSKFIHCYHNEAYIYTCKMNDGETVEQCIERLRQDGYSISTT